MEINKKIDQKDDIDMRLQSVDDDQSNTDVDIGATDNGYTAMVRAFTKAAYANKVDDNSENPDAEKKSEMEESAESILMDLLQKEMDELAAYTQTLMTEVREQLDDLRNQRRALYDEQKAILEKFRETADEHNLTTAEMAQAEQEKENLQAQKEQADIKAEEAMQDQSACTKDQPASCSIKEDNAQVQELVEEGHDKDKAIAMVAETKAQEALAEQAQLDRQLQATEARLNRLSKGRERLDERLQVLQQEADVNQDKIARNQQIEKKLEQRENELKEFQARTNDPAFKKAMAEGRVTKAQLDAMTPEFMRKDRNHGRTVSEPAAKTTQDEPARPVIETAKPAIAETRTTSSLASTLNDGGGIKAESLQGPFAAAASGASPAEIVPMPPPPAIEQNRRMSMNSAFG